MTIDLHVRYPRPESPITSLPWTILGRRADGRPIYPIAGGAPDGDSGDGQDSGQSGDQNDAGDGSQANGSGQQGDQNDGQSGGQNGTSNVWDDPAKAKAEIERLRGEAGKARTNAKTAAADEARQKLTQDIGKALGLVKDDEKADPAKLTEQLTAAQSAHRLAQVELKVFRLASKHQGDPSALLDSRSFLAKVADLDPAANDFAAKVETAIKDAVKDNPKLKTGQVSGASSVDHPGGTGEGRSEKPKSITDAVASHYGT